MGDPNVHPDIVGLLNGNDKLDDTRVSWLHVLFASCAFPFLRTHFFVCLFLVSFWFLFIPLLEGS